MVLAQLVERSLLFTVLKRRKLRKRGREWPIKKMAPLELAVTFYNIASFNSIDRRDDRNGMAPEPRRRFNALTMEITPMANKVFHLSFPLAIGRIQQEDPMIYNYTSSMMPQPGPGHGGNWNRNDPYRNGPRALGVQPGINLEVNLFKYVKVFGGANYRFAFGEEKTHGMAKAAGTIGVKVGVFDKRIRSANAH